MLDFLISVNTSQKILRRKQLMHPADQKRRHFKNRTQRIQKSEANEKYSILPRFPQ